MSKLALIHVLGPRTPVDPGYGKPTPPARPDTKPPSGGSITNPIVLPPEIWPPEPTSPPRPDNTLPEVPLLPSTLPVFPPNGDWDKPVEPAQKFELKWSPVYGWVLVPVGNGTEIDNTLPPSAQPKSSR